MKNLKLKIRRNVRLAPYTTFKIGGRVEYFVETEAENLPAVVTYFKNEKIPYQVIAGGSNVVFGDGRIRGAVIKIKSNSVPYILPHLQHPYKLENVRMSFVECEAGIELGELVRFAGRHGLAGVEKLAGIPGSVGGAVIGSAGAYGHSIKDVVEKVLVYDAQSGKRRWFSNKDCGFSYRESVFKTKKGRNWVVLNVIIRLRKGVSQRLQKISRQIIKIREKKYPPRLKCPGSFFKNVLVANVPKSALLKIDENKIIDGKIPAGYLLEQVGAKGMRHGRVKVADFHGNLLINSGGATCREVARLASILKSRVRKKFGIKLEEEIRYMG